MRKIPMGLNTVRKKVLMLSKLAGVAIVIFYLVTAGLVDTGTAFWVWFLLMVLVVLGVDYLLGKMISRPLLEINDMARQMAKLDFSAYCNVDTDDEFGELAKHLNIMFANLKDALQKLEDANEQLELANQKLEQDVEKEKMLLAQRKELADSLSHEMKTPLGLIRAYTEGLREEADEGKKQEYMGSILAAVDRMDQTVVSLLDLSALEAGVVQLREERFDFVELTEVVAGRLLLNLPDAKHDFSYELPDEKVYIYADRSRMEQVLTNLIENAKRYVAPEGKIHLSVTCGTEFMRFGIYNDGETFSEEELEKIWRKFYRGQNTRPGGSGLGLASVSQILSLYHISCHVHNLERGVEFFFEFPIAC